MVVSQTFHPRIGNKSIYHTRALCNSYFFSIFPNSQYTSYFYRVSRRLQNISDPQLFQEMWRHLKFKIKTHVDDATKTYERDLMKLTWITFPCNTILSSNTKATQILFHYLNKNGAPYFILEEFAVFAQCSYDLHIYNIYLFIYRPV